MKLLEIAEEVRKNIVNTEKYITTWEKKNTRGNKSYN